MGVTVEKLSANLYVDVARYTGHTTSGAVAWYDMRDFRHFMAIVHAAALTGTGVTAFSIKAAPAASATNEQTIVSHAVGSAPDGEDDFLMLECSAEQIAQIGAAAGYDLRYVAVYLTVNNSSDLLDVVHIFGGPRFAHSGLTADSVA